MALSEQSSETGGMVRAGVSITTHFQCRLLALKRNTPWLFPLSHPLCRRMS